MEITITSRDAGKKTFDVTIEAWEQWPEDKDLIAFCDNGRRYFGGRVETVTDSMKRVTVYTD